MTSNTGNLSQEWNRTNDFRVLNSLSCAVFPAFADSSGLQSTHTDTAALGHFPGLRRSTLLEK